MFDIGLSEGTISNMVQNVKEKGIPAYTKIHDMMQNESVVGGDKTTENINGKLKYYNVIAKGHQICLAHLLRNLQYLDQLDTKQTWSERMQDLFRYAIRQRKHIDWADIDRNSIVKRLEELLWEPLDKLHVEFSRLQNSLRKWKDAVFTFLYDESVPSDNNASEGAIRKAKSKLLNSY